MKVKREHAAKHLVVKEKARQANLQRANTQPTRESKARKNRYT